jgi:hypothetical protein
MSMAEMAVTMGLVGLGALGAASLSGNMVTGSKKIQGVVAQNNFATSLNAYLYSNMGCQDLKLLGSLNTTPKDIILTKWSYQGITKFEGGYDANNQKKTPTRGFDIAALQGYLETDPNPSSITDTGGKPLVKSILKVKASLKVGNMSKEFLYNVPVLVDNGTIKYCSDEKNLAETCAAAQGVYNPVTQQCDLGSGCRIKDTYNELTCKALNHAGKGFTCSPIFGPSKVNQYTGGYSCPPPSVATQSQSETWISKRDCGKKCTQSVENTMVWHICMECPP